MPAQTLLEKIVAAHLAEGTLAPGAEIRIRIDQTLCQDATGTMVFLELEAMGVSRVQTDLSVQYIDHNTSQLGPENQNDHLYLQSICAAKGVRFSRPGNGICHQVHLERFAVPGTTLLGSDSHTPTSGGIGALAIGAGGLDVALAMAGEPFKLAMPRCIGVRLTGTLPPWVAAKDVILHLLSVLSTKGNVGWAVEYFGPGVASLSVPERATVTNMGAELGVTASVFPSDVQTRRFLEAQQRGSAWVPLAADAGARYERVIDVDLNSLAPLAACPSSPDRVRPVAELGNVPVCQVVIGSCTNSSLQDMMTVAELLTGRRVHPNVSLGIAPGSRQVLTMLAANGALARMVEAGARILESACGPCIGQGFSPATDGATVRTFNRNFGGRTGTPDDRCYLVSPETAVATALHGCISDPRQLEAAPVSWSMPAEFQVDDSMIAAPAAAAAEVAIIRKPTIGEPPRVTPLPDALEGTVLIRLDDKVTTDHIMPAGRFLKLRSNIPEYSRVVFDGLTVPGQPSFAERAVAVRDAGGVGVIVAGESYGQGSSREHAAICPLYLGVRLVLALSIERIHAANLVNFGILPLLFADRSDYERIQADDRVCITAVRRLLAPDTTLEGRILPAAGQAFACRLRHALSAADIRVVLAGGRLAPTE